VLRYRLSADGAEREQMSQDSPGEARPETGSALERLVYFSDAIFAISITLLILPLADVRLSEARAGEELRDLLPEVYTFALSFVVIGVFWMQHHRYFRDIAAFDDGLIRLNLAFLFCIVFMPFPTAALGRVGNSAVVTALYAATIAVTSAVTVVIWWYVSRDGGRLLVPGVPRSRTIHRLTGGSIAAVVFAASIPLAFVEADLAKYSWIAVYPLSVLAARLQRISGLRR
jgi:uncharacterized membrane protein